MFHMESFEYLVFPVFLALIVVSERLCQLYIFSFGYVQLLVDLLLL